MINQIVRVYDRYRFAVPVLAIVTGVSEKDGAYQVTFIPETPGVNINVVKHSGTYVRHQQCEVVNTNIVEVPPHPPNEEIDNLKKKLKMLLERVDRVLGNTSPATLKKCCLFYKNNSPLTCCRK